MTSPADTERSWEDDFERMVGHRYPCFGANTCAACLQVTNSNLENELERLRQREAALQAVVDAARSELEYIDNRWAVDGETVNMLRDDLRAALAETDARSPVDDSAPAS